MRELAGPSGSGTGGAGLRSGGIDQPARCTSRRPQVVFAVTALGAFMASLDLSIVNVAFPALQHSFPDDSRATLAWVITAYTIVFASLLVTAGRTADRLGRRRVFFVGLGVFTLGSALCALAPSVPLLIAGRLVQGIGAAAMVPSSVGLLLGAFPVERRAQIVALWGGVGALAVATGPSLGAALITVGGWRWAFFVNLPIGLVAWLVGRRVLVESRAEGTQGRPDYGGVAVLVGALAALVLGISEGPTWGWGSARIIVCFAIVPGLGAIFLYRSARHPEPVLDLTLFAARSFSVTNAATVLYAMGFYAMLLGNVLFLTGVWHYSILRAGLAITPGPLVVAAVSGPAGRLAGRVGFRAILVIGSAVFAGGLLWYATRVGVQPAYLTEWLPATLLTGLGIGLTFPIMSAAAVSSLPGNRFAVGSAVNQTARQVGGSLGIALLVVILGTPSTAASALVNFRHLWLFATVAAILSGAVATRLGPAQRVPPLVPTGTPAATYALADRQSV
jgi:EmrB/QacA subfamily drug resistance transporter